ncbi:hypothetical protein [Streptomyces sp. NPDC046939]|uniref:hypothetical protein n=1 Tax=Streptomyces sp. NPDC046939 TaxID=3155376 RepID=UPI0033C566F5
MTDVDVDAGLRETGGGRGSDVGIEAVGVGAHGSGAQQFYDGLIPRSSATDRHGEHSAAMPL